MYYIYAHIFCMILMVLLIAIALTILTLKPQQWVKKHMFFAGLGIIIGVIGVSNIALRYTVSGHTHFMTFHSQIGISTLCTLLLTLSSGILVFKGKRKLLYPHKLFGILGIVGIIGTVFLGVSAFLSLPLL